MRPAGEVRLALIQAARDIVAQIGQPDRGATLAEMAAAVGSKCPLGRDVARRYVDNMHRSGDLKKVGERRVPNRNRPVYEYAPVFTDGEVLVRGVAVLSNCMSSWTR
ncbi:MAG: hypothetical protein A3I66_00710 [Burkholderiales bacterium RIFCSPLOWO2_02_FULL_57_36]|nr:MAG: hypothetical protein A3I66_00710 [Burkholderiales bacterium RIFCSPLOWO2_02_FULL_57_36]